MALTNILLMSQQGRLDVGLFLRSAFWRRWGQ